MCIVWKKRIQMRNQLFVSARAEHLCNALGTKIYILNADCETFRKGSSHIVHRRQTFVWKRSTSRARLCLAEYFQRSSKLIKYDDHKWWLWPLWMDCIVYGRDYMCACRVRTRVYLNRLLAFFISFNWYSECYVYIYIKRWVAGQNWYKVPTQFLWEKAYSGYSQVWQCYDAMRS